MVSSLAFKGLKLRFLSLYGKHQTLDFSMAFFSTQHASNNRF